MRGRGEEDEVSKGDAIKCDTSAAGSTAYKSASAVVQASQPIDFVFQDVQEHPLRRTIPLVGRSFSCSP